MPQLQLQAFFFIFQTSMPPSLRWPTYNTNRVATPRLFVFQASKLPSLQACDDQHTTLIELQLQIFFVFRLPSLQSCGGQHPTLIELQLQAVFCFRAPMPPSLQWPASNTNRIATPSLFVFFQASKPPRFQASKARSRRWPRRDSRSVNHLFGIFYATAPTFAGNELI